MSIVMFCVTLLSVLCVLVIVTGGSVLAGLVIFYFVIRIFRCLFYDEIYGLCGTQFHSCTLGRHGKSGKQCGSGGRDRRIDSLSRGGNVILISSVVLVLFARISIAMFATERQQGKKKTEDAQALDLGAFAQKYSLTKRETEVLEQIGKISMTVRKIWQSNYLFRERLCTGHLLP